MELYYKVKALMLEYIVTRKPTALLAAIEELETEISDPSIQEATLTHDFLTIRQLDEMARENNFLRLNVEEVTNEGSLEFDKFIRVFGHDSVEAVLMLKLVHMDDRTIILIPFGPGPTDENEPS